MMSEAEVTKHNTRFLCIVFYEAYMKQHYDCLLALRLTSQVFWLFFSFKLELNT